MGAESGHIGSRGGWFLQHGLNGCGPGLRLFIRDGLLAIATALVDQRYQLLPLLRERSERMARLLAHVTSLDRQSHISGGSIPALEEKETEDAETYDEPPFKWEHIYDVSGAPPTAWVLCKLPDRKVVGFGNDNHCGARHDQDASTFAELRIK